MIPFPSLAPQPPARRVDRLGRAGPALWLLLALGCGAATHRAGSSSVEARVDPALAALPCDSLRTYAATDTGSARLPGPRLLEESESVPAANQLPKGRYRVVLLVDTHGRVAGVRTMLAPPLSPTQRDALEAHLRSFRFAPVRIGSCVLARPFPYQLEVF